MQGGSRRTGRVGRALVALTTVGALVMGAVATDASGAVPPPIEKPTWTSTYDWPGGDGYAGWKYDRAASDDEAYGFFRNLNDQPGLWLWPTGGRRYEPDNAGWHLRAPGTTRIARATLSVAHPNNLFAHHCLRIGLRDDDGDARDVRTFCKPPSKPATQSHHELWLFDPSGSPTAKELFVELVLPACERGTARACSKWIPAEKPLDDGVYVRVKDADLTLVDDDDPLVRPSKAFWDLDGTYIDGRETYPLRVDSDDAGSGVTGIEIDHAGWPGPQPPLARHEAECDPRHHTRSLGARICTPDTAIDLDVDTNPMPEGTRHFRAHTADVAGNVGDRRWTVIIDRTPPTPPTDLRFTTPEEGSGQAAWDAAQDPVLPDGTPGSGVKYYEARWKVDAGEWSGWDRMSSAARLSAELYDKIDGTRLQFEVRAIDAVGNVGEAASAGGEVPGAPPRITTSGRLADLAGGYVGRENAAVTLAADDDGAGLPPAGVRRLWLEREGAGDVGSADTGCTSRTRDGQPWKALCPDTAQREFTVNASELPEGAQTFVARGVDRAHNATAEPRWTVLVDHTPPSMPGTIEGGVLDEEEGTIDIQWDPSFDPGLPGGAPGSGVAKYYVRVRFNNADWSDWMTTTEAAIEVAVGGQRGLVDVVVSAVDAVGNASDAAATTLEILSDEDLDTEADDPEGQEPAPGSEDPIDDDDLSGALLNPLGVMQGVEVEYPHDPMAHAAANPPIQDCGKSGWNGDQYAWWRFKRKAPSAAAVANDWAKYSMHFQARAAWIWKAERAQLEVWRKLWPTDKKRKRHVKQTDPNRPKTKYYAHMNAHFRVNTYFRWRAEIKWAGKGIYVKTIVLPNGTKIDKFWQFSINYGGCRAVWR